MKIYFFLKQSFSTVVYLVRSLSWYAILTIAMSFLRLMHMAYKIIKGNSLGCLFYIKKSIHLFDSFFCLKALIHNFFYVHYISLIWVLLPMYTLTCTWIYLCTNFKYLS